MALFKEILQDGACGSGAAAAMGTSVGAVLEAACFCMKRSVRKASLK